MCSWPAIPGILPLADGSVDLIVTSPPYANAIDYMRAHKFSLVWLGQPIANLSHLRGKYIGAERQDTGGVPQPCRLWHSRRLPDLSEIDRQKSRVL